MPIHSQWLLSSTSANKPTNQQTNPTNQTHRTNQTTTTGLRFLVVVTSWLSPVDDMMLHGDHGAGWRRRQRRLRSWWRHEQLSIAAALATFMHHSYDKVAAGEKYYGVRAQNTDRAEAAHCAPRRPATKAARGAELFQLFEEELRCGRRGGSCSTPWSTLTTSVPSCRFSMLLCRRRENSW